jgi:hypothetical protein
MNAPIKPPEEFAEAKRFLLALSPNGPWTLTAIRPFSALAARRTETQFCRTIEQAMEFVAERNGKLNIHMTANTVKPVGYFDDTFRHDPDRDRVDDKRGLVELAWGYCITCHKAQGGEYPSVLVLDDGLYFTSWPNPDMHRRWLYTAATRPTDQLTIRRNT